MSSIGKSLPHDSAREHVSGESFFIDDRPLVQGEVFVDYVGSPVAAGLLRAIDASEALKIPGVVAVFSSKDFAYKYWGTIKHDQPFLVEEAILYPDEPLCLVVAETREALKRAKKAMRFTIDERSAVLTIDEAIAKKDFLYEPKPMVRGDVEKALASAPHRLRGEFVIGGQEHFYLETQAAIAYPLEGGQIEIHSSSQHPTEGQHVVAKALGIPQSDVVFTVKRMGGAFGGKESQAGPFAAYVALVAQKLKRPARIVLHQEDDFRVTGKRHPFKNFYEVGFDDEGKILALKLKLYANGGAYLDLSSSILDRAMYHSDGCYFIENIQVEAATCRTNQHSNTAFRGFGGPQGNMTTENIIEEMAIYLKKDAYDIRRKNLYGKETRNTTHYGQTVSKNLLPEIFDRLAETSDYQKRAREIASFNQHQVGKLRGISMTGVKFGIAFTARFLNQGSAQLHLHRDGTVQVSTGATEMGQGVNTKIRQIVASAFAIPTESVRVMATSTEKNANTSPTAASSGADINGAAAEKACLALQQRLRWVFYCEQNKIREAGEIPSRVDPKVDLGPYVFRDGFLWDERTKAKMAWKDLLNTAYLNRIALSEHAHFKTEGLTPTSPFRYFTSGAAVSEVEINEYTGELKVLRSDLLMDLGRPINPGIDRGQVTGGFIQGMGWVTSENLYYDPKGHLRSASPTTYKIPNVQDTPRVFNVDLIENPDHNEAVARSKAVGEPPLLLSASVIMAVKNALASRSRNEIPKLSSPATPEVILLELSRYEHPEL